MFSFPFLKFGSASWLSNFDRYFDNQKQILGLGYELQIAKVKCWSPKCLGVAIHVNVGWKIC